MQAGIVGPKVSNVSAGPTRTFTANAFWRFSAASRWAKSAQRTSGRSRRCFTRTECRPEGPITLVRTVLRAAHESGCLDEMPAVPSGPSSVSRKLPSAPSSEDVEVMLRGPGWLGVAIALAALAGMRMGEVRALEVRDIEFDQRHIVIRRAMSEDRSLTPKVG